MYPYMVIRSKWTVEIWCSMCLRFCSLLQGSIHNASMQPFVAVLTSKLLSMLLNILIVKSTQLFASISPLVYVNKFLLLNWNSAWDSVIMSLRVRSFVLLVYISCHFHIRYDITVFINWIALLADWIALYLCFLVEIVLS